MDAEGHTDNEELQRAAQAALEDAARPPSGEESGEVDFFDTSEDTKVFPLPGSRTQSVTLKRMREGEKKKYQNMVNRDLTLEKGSGNARIKTTPGDERHLLLGMCIVDFDLLKDGLRFPFSEKNVKVFLNAAPPKVIEAIEKEVHVMNPWLLADMSVEDMNTEIDRLTELRDLKIKEEEGNAVSGT